MMATCPVFTPCHPWQGYVLAPAECRGRVEVFGENRFGSAVWIYAVRFGDGHTSSVPVHLIDDRLIALPIPPAPSALP